MAVDLVQLKADLNKIQEADLEQVRVLVDDALLVGPEEDLADQEIVAVFNQWKLNRTVRVRVVINGQPNPGVFNTQVLTSLTPTVGYVPASSWLFDWFNKRK